MWTRDREPIGECYCCGRAIYADEAHYEFPFEEMVCEDSECVEEWLEEHKTYGGIPLI